MAQDKTMLVAFVLVAVFGCAAANFQSCKLISKLSAHLHKFTKLFKHRTIGNEIEL